jgi:hypothetical protein
MRRHGGIVAAGNDDRDKTPELCFEAPGALFFRDGRVWMWATIARASEFDRRENPCHGAERKRAGYGSGRKKSPRHWNQLHSRGL